MCVAVKHQDAVEPGRSRGSHSFWSEDAVLLLKERKHIGTEVSGGAQRLPPDGGWTRPGPPTRPRARSPEAQAPQPLALLPPLSPSSPRLAASAPLLTFFEEVTHFEGFYSLFYFTPFSPFNQILCVLLIISNFCIIFPP